MSDQGETNEQALQAKVARLNKVVQALMDRAESNANIQGSDFNLFHTAVALEDQVRRRTGELEAARLENEKVTRALRESEDRLSATLRSIGDGVIACDASGNVISLNASAENLTGWSTEEAGGQPIAGIFHIINAETRQEVQIPVERVLREDCIINLANHTILIARDGTEHQIADSCAPIHNAGNAVIGAVLVFRDVTGEYRQREMLRESEERYRRLFDTSQDAMMTSAPPSWKFTTGNSAALKMFGVRDEAEFTSLGPWDVSPERQPDGHPSADAAREEIETGMREGHHFFEWTHRRLDGTDFPATVLITRVEMADQAFVQATVRDITAQKQAEQALLETNRLLKDAVALANDMAAEAAMSNAAKSEFLAHMSHELRTPLNVIIGFSEIIKNRMMGPCSEKYPEYAGDIYTSGTHLLALINDVLDLSKIEANQIVINRTPQDIAKIIRGCEGMMAVKFQERTQDLTIDLPQDMPLASVDERAIKQVILNLLSNANKYTRDGGSITIAAFRNAPENTICIEVRDNGIGIPPELHELVFKPFHQSGKVMTREQGGTGLGLSISRKLVELHGGTLTLSSAVGQGTTIRVTLPVDPLPSRQAT